jgi:hypothetical protein
MGLFSEIARGEARNLLSILDKAKSSNNLVIVAFCRENVYPLYLNALGEAWESEPDEVSRFWRLSCTE